MARPGRLGRRPSSTEGTLKMSLSGSMSGRVGALGAAAAALLARAGREVSASEAGPAGADLEELWLATPAERPLFSATGCAATPYRGSGATGRTLTPTSQTCRHRTGLAVPPTRRRLAGGTPGDARALRSRFEGFL